MDLEHAADSTIAKASARILMPIMVVALTIALTVTGFFFKRLLDNQDKANEEFREAQKETAAKVTSIDKNFTVFTQRVDTMLIRQVDQNSEALKDHEQRLERIERAVPLP